MINSNNYFVSQSYNNFEQYSLDVKRWDLDFRKFNTGDFRGQTTLLDVGNIQIGKTQLKGTIQQNGLTPKGYRSFVIPANSEQSFIWLNRKVSNNNILIFPKSCDLDAVSYNNFSVFVISIEENYLQHLIAENQLKNLNTTLDFSEKVITINQAFSNYLQSSLQSLFNKLLLNNDIINTQSTLFQIREKIPVMLLNFLNKNNFTSSITLNRKRDLALKKSIDYINSNNLKNISLSKLQEITSASQRTIEYAFLERFGVTPKNYLTNIKLHEVKHILQNPSNRELISKVANEFGFNHMGQFSADYKNFFGELPSETIFRIKGLEKVIS